jgi:hypothetical protein
MGSGLLALLLLALSGALACHRDGRSDGRTVGQLTAEWKDSAGRVVRWSAPAEARWCARDTLLEITALRNDSGIGLALFAGDSLRAEGYPVFQSGMFAPWRPQATAAVRWLTANTLKGFESGSGQVVITRGGSRRASGTFDVRAKLAGGADSLRLTGGFAELAIEPAPPLCGRANKPIPR